MWSGSENSTQRLQAFGEAIFEQNSTTTRNVISGSIAVAENTTSAIREATISLLTALLKTYLLHPNDIIAAFFLTDLTAEYPARAARELAGWQFVPLLCARQAGPLAERGGNLTIVLFANAQPEAQAANHPRLRGIRGATILDEQSTEQIQRQMHWLGEQMLLRNTLQQEDLAGVVITITPDLDATAALPLAQALLSPTVPLLLLYEIDVPAAPKPCIRLLFIARMADQPRPVYSEQALRLLRPDLIQQGTPHATPPTAETAALQRAPSVSQTIRISPSGPLTGAVTVPASKYHTLRAILAATLAEGVSTVHTPALSDDTAVLLKACAQIGANITTSRQDEKQCTLQIRGIGGRLASNTPLTIDVGNAGAVLRLLLGICAASPAEITFTTPYQESLGRRPNDDLLGALAQLGAQIKHQGPEGTLPITMQGGRMRGRKVRLSGKKSSQYLSALLYLGPLLEDGLEIEITDGLTSASFVALTIQMLQQAGITIIEEPERRYRIPGAQHYSSQEYYIPGDYPSAAALLAAVAVAGGEITMEGLAPDDPSGAALLAAFSEMGLDIRRTKRTSIGITAWSQKPLRGLVFDGNLAIDSVPCLAAAACFATTPSHIYNIANLRLKESDRIYDLASALGALGCQISPSADALNILPADHIRGGVAVDAHSDHRLAQALAIAALGCEQPIILRNTQHVAKSYPRFFDDLASLGAQIEEMSGMQRETRR